MISPQDLIKKAKNTDFALSNFLTVEQASIIKNTKDKTLKFFFDGGFSDAERTRCIIMGSNLDNPQDEEFNISFIKITPYNLDNKITHRHVLGTVLALGIKREYLGDINFSDGLIYLACDDVISDFIVNNLTSILNIMVSCEKVKLEDIKINIKEEEKQINVASLRLDAVIARSLNISRNSSLEMIEKGLVQVNHMECLNTSYFLKENDLISIRHFGRISMGKIVNTTKKDRLVVIVKIKH